MKPLLIGLTGGVGVGKSSVAALLKEHGAQIVSGDELGKLALEQSPPALAAVRSRFGPGVFTSDGKLLRRELGKRVFSSKEAARWLTELTFPRIHELWQEAVRCSTSDALVLDASLILEWGIEDEFDLLVVVEAAEDIARQRMAASGRLTMEEAVERRNVQVEAKRKAESADAIIKNNGSLDELRSQVNEFWSHTIMPKLERRKFNQHD